MSLPYFPFYPKDFEADTSHLTLEEDGAYNRLLRLCWMTPGCSIPDDEAWIMRRLRVDADTFERVVRVVLDEFFTVKAGRILSPRLAKEWQKTDLAHRKRVSAGSKGGAAKAAKAKGKPLSNAKAMPKQPEPEPEPKTPTVSNIAQSGFDEFWAAVPRKVGKGQARKAYAAALKKTDHAALMAGITAYAASRQGEDPQFTKHPASWLNGECWDDEPQPTGGTHDARGSAARGRGRNDGHAALMAGFAAAAHSDTGGLPSHSEDVSGAFDTGEQGMDSGPRGNASESFLRLVNG